MRPACPVIVSRAVGLAEKPRRQRREALSALRDGVVSQPLSGQLRGGEDAHRRMRAMLVGELAEAAAMGQGVGQDDGEADAMVGEFLEDLSSEAGAQVEE